MTLHIVAFVFPCDFLRRIYSFAYLQPGYFEGRGLLPSASLQLQQAGVGAGVGVEWGLVAVTPGVAYLPAIVAFFWVLYASTLMEIRLFHQRFLLHNYLLPSFDFAWCQVYIYIYIYRISFINNQN
jgi:hypothetical protein